MSILKELGSGQGYLKGGFLGLNKSGKTVTATYLACIMHKMMGCKKPIAFFDTEGGAEYVVEIVEKMTGMKPIGIRSRAFSDLITVGEECENDGIEVLLVDSITHVWRELGVSYLEQVNDALKRKGWKPRTRFTIGDVMGVKEKWQPWPDWYTNSKVHAIVCGRAGFEWDEVEDENGNKKLVKTGVKMKAESEFGFEPSLLVEMERAQDISGETTKIWRRATIIGDRFRVLDGLTGNFKKCDTIEAESDAVREFFWPHLSRLTPGAHAPVDVNPKTPLGLDDEGDMDWQTEKRQRTILAEEIKGLLVEKYPGQTKDEKGAKEKLIFEAFDTRSWTKVESMTSEKLRAGLGFIQAKFDAIPAVDESVFSRLRNAITLATEPAHIDKAAEEIGNAAAELKPEEMQELLKALEEGKLNVA